VQDTKRDGGESHFQLHRRREGESLKGIGQEASLKKERRERSDKLSWKGRKGSVPQPMVFLNPFVHKLERQEQGAPEKRGGRGIFVKKGEVVQRVQEKKRTRQLRKGQEGRGQRRGNSKGDLLG